MGEALQSRRLSKMATPNRQTHVENNSTELRTFEQIKQHYAIEKELADRLRNATQEQRSELYHRVYNELYRRVPLHPQLTRKSLQSNNSKNTISLIRPFLHEKTVFLEIGPGDCAVSLSVARFVQQVYAIDVSDEINKDVTPPRNFSLILSDGRSIPVESNTVDVAFSNQLMEHLHPDDAVEQLQNIYDALASGGVYICITPNRLSGPHDVSKYFDRVATGLHLKEYSVSELRSLFLNAGFSRLEYYIRIKARHFKVAIGAPVLCEAMLALVPAAHRKVLSSSLPFRVFLEGFLVGIK